MYIDRYVMREVHILPISILLLSSLGIVLGDEAFATIEVPNMTQTESSSDGIQNVAPQDLPGPVEQLAMSAQFAPDENSLLPNMSLLPNDSFWIKPDPE